MKFKPFIIPLFIPHIGCPHRCVFCNQTSITGHKGGAPSPEEVRNAIKNIVEKDGFNRIQEEFDLDTQEMVREIAGIEYEY